MDVGIIRFEGIYNLLGPNRADAAARNDAFLDRRAGGIQCVVDAVFLLLHLDFVAPPTLITATPPASFAKRSWSFSLVVVRGRFLDLLLDLGDAGLDVGLLAVAVDNRGVFLLDAHLLGAAEHV